MLNLLRELAAGKTFFKAQSGSLDDLSAFQYQVAIAQEAHEKGYVECFEPHEESYTGRRFIDAFKAGALTDHGRNYLAAR